MIVTAAVLLVPKLPLGNGVGAAKPCLAIKAKRCRAGTARRYFSLKIIKRPVAQAFSLGARTGKMPAPPETFPNRAGQAPDPLIIFLKALPPGAFYGYFDKLKP